MEKEEAFNQYYGRIAKIIDRYEIDDLSQTNHTQWWFLRHDHCWYIDPDMQVFDCGPADTINPVVPNTNPEPGLTIFPNLIMDLSMVYTALVEDLCPPGYEYQGRAEEGGHAYHVYTDGKIERWIAITETTDLMKVTA